MQCKMQTNYKYQYKGKELAAKAVTYSVRAARDGISTHSAFTRSNTLSREHQNQVHNGPWNPSELSPCDR